MYVSSDDDSTFNVFLFLGSLLGHLLDDTVIYITVEFVKGDVSITVEVGLPGG